MSEPPPTHEEVSRALDAIYSAALALARTTQRPPRGKAADAPGRRTPELLERLAHDIDAARALHLRAALAASQSRQAPGSTPSATAAGPQGKTASRR
jgi:hypothetical protein